MRMDFCILEDADALAQKARVICCYGDAVIARGFIVLPLALRLAARIRITRAIGKHTDSPRVDDVPLPTRAR